MAQTALPGLAPDPYRLEPLRPSYAKLCRQLESVAKTSGCPVALLTDQTLADHAARVGWSPATLATLTRVAHAHGLAIEPETSPRPKSRPAGLMLSQLTVTGPDRHPSQQRTAALAALMWRHPAPLAWWRRCTFADLVFVGGDVEVLGHRCRGTSETVAVWRDTVLGMYSTPPDRLPFLARLDGRLRAVGERVVELDWAEWMGGVTLDRWRAWAIDAGALPVGRGSDRHRHR